MGGTNLSRTDRAESCFKSQPVSCPLFDGIAIIQVYRQQASSLVYTWMLQLFVMHCFLFVVQACDSWHRGSTSKCFHTFPLCHEFGVARAACHPDQWLSPDLKCLFLSGQWFWQPAATRVFPGPSELAVSLVPSCRKFVQQDRRAWEVSRCRWYQKECAEEIFEGQSFKEVMSRFLLIWNPKSLHL